MSLQTLIERLKKERPIGADDEAQKQEWIAALGALFSMIEGWLGPAVADGVLTILHADVERADQDLGNYTAPTLEIRSGRFTVRFDPVGPRVLGIVRSGGGGLLDCKAELIWYVARFAFQLCAMHRVPGR